jgi:hypothetical protein
LAKYVAVRRRISFSIGRAQLSTQAHQLGPLVGVQAVSPATVDVVLLHPTAQTRGGDAEVGGDVSYGFVADAGQLNGGLAELISIALWHRDILPRDGVSPPQVRCPPERGKLREGVAADATAEEFSEVTTLAGSSAGDTAQIVCQKGLTPATG